MGYISHHLRHSELPITYRWIGMNYIIVLLVRLYFVLCQLAYVLSKVTFVNHIYYKTQPISLDASSSLRIQLYESARRFMQTISHFHPYFPNVNRILRGLKLHANSVAASVTRCQSSQ